MITLSTNGYDNHGRLAVSWDIRNGTTTYTYNDADLTSSVTTPSPSGTGSGQVTSTYYNKMLQATNVALADSTAVYTAYDPKGGITLTYGSRTYPVGYGYDVQGRLKTMTNWTAFSSAGARVTTWNYDTNRGWLIGKYYPNASTGAGQTTSGVLYTNTAAGRLASRTWVRGLTSKYGYGDAGDLTSIDYSDSTPDVSYTYDRRGRMKTATQNGMTTTIPYNNLGQSLGESYSSGILVGLAVTNIYDAYSRRATNELWDGSAWGNLVCYSYVSVTPSTTIP